jgi:large subunit ribosomal protein L13
MNKKLLKTMNSTYVLSAKDIEQKWLIIDAKDQSLGRVASRAAYMLKGKHKPDYAYNLDNGDYVIIINAKDIVLTGNKKKNKIHYRHTGHPGGIKAISYGELLEKNPEKMVQISVKGMLSHNPLGRQHLRKLKVYAGAEHNHAANKPTLVMIEQEKTNG